VRSVDNFALDLIGPTTVVPQAASASTDICFGHGDRLAIVQGLNGSEQVEILLKEIRKLHKASSAVSR
jgi:hypothetical protein